jgi:hypothetical protein
MTSLIDEIGLLRKTSEILPYLAENQIKLQELLA